MNPALGQVRHGQAALVPPAVSIAAAGIAGVASGVAAGITASIPTGIASGVTVPVAVAVPVASAAVVLVRFVASVSVGLIIWMDNDGDWFYEVYYPLMLVLWFFALFYSEAHNRIEPFLCLDGLWKRACDWGWNRTRKKFKIAYPDKYCPPASEYTPICN